MSALTPGQFGIALSLSCIAASAFLLVPLAQRHERARQRLLALRKAGNAPFSTMLQGMNGSVGFNLVLTSMKTSPSARSVPAT